MCLQELEQLICHWVSDHATLSDLVTSCTNSI